MRAGLILDSRRTRQQVVQQKFALWVEARFNSFRDSAGCTIVMRWQPRLKSNSSEGQTLFLQPGRGTVHIFCKHLSPGDESACHPKPKTCAKEKEILLIACTASWRTTAHGRLTDRFGSRQVPCAVSTSSTETCLGEAECFRHKCSRNPGCSSATRVLVRTLNMVYSKSSRLDGGFLKVFQPRKGGLQCLSKILWAKQRR
jgi:hypothetical protein